MPKLLLTQSWDDGSPGRVVAEGSESRRPSVHGERPVWDLSAPAFEPDKMWTAVDLEKAGMDLRQLCVEYAAVGVCPRGRACAWVHCRLDTSK